VLLHGLRDRSVLLRRIVGQHVFDGFPCDGGAVNHKKRSKHLWLIELRKPKGKRPRRVEIIIDSRQDDPVAVEEVVRRRLALPAHVPSCGL